MNPEPIGLDARLAVSEVFGPTIQGEGKNLGRPVMFLRLMGCNQHCVWCDTPWTWRFSEQWPHEGGKVFSAKEETKIRTASELLDALEFWPNRGLTRSLVLSGGEPMLQQDQLQPLTEALRIRGWWVEMETAGTVVPMHESLVAQYTVSPKLSNSGNAEALRHNKAALRKFAALSEEGKAVFKFVCADMRDMQEADAIVREYEINELNVYVMPLGITQDALNIHTHEIVEAAMRRGYNITTRLHITLYGNRRGV